MAALAVKDKYYLRSLHEEIGLYDRKLAHLAKYDNFASDKEREQASDKLTAKRDLLVRNARLLVEAGIEYKTSDLPRSLRTDEEPVAAEPKAAAPVEAAPEADVVPQASSAAEPPYQGTALDFRSEINQYVQKRRKTAEAAEAASEAAAVNG